jgi:hypothetical protein
MAKDVGRWRLTWSEVRSRNVIERPTSMAAHHVEARENNAVWTKATWSAMVLIGRTELFGRTELTEQFGLATNGAAALVASKVAGAW